MDENNKLESYWTDRYHQGFTGWDIGYASTPLVTYFDQIQNKNLRILIPGAGNAYEAEYLHKAGFTSVEVLDISTYPLMQLQERCPDFPSSHLHQADFFEFEGTYDLIIEQTFFCSFDPTSENRINYAKQMHNLLADGGKLVGLWFDIPLTPTSKRPFGGTREAYISYLSPYFNVDVLERCYNSIKPREGNELFGIFTKKDV